MKKITIIFKILISIVLLIKVSYANNVGKQTGLDLPRFISLKSNESNIRVGPSKNYPITLKYIIKDYPLKIIEEYNDWRKIIDFQNNTGWIHKSLIKSERNGIIISGDNKEVYIYNNVFGWIIGEISNGTIVNLSKCKLNWCHVSKNNRKGWIKKEYIWGIKNSEVFGVGVFQTLTDYYFKSLTFLENYLS